MPLSKSFYFRPGLLALTLFYFLPTLIFAAEESITVTTYYPSPYGVYSEMRLYPKDNPTACDNNQRGLMYYDATANQLRICTGTPPYQSLSGYWAASTSNINDIYNTNSGNVGIGTTDPLQLRLYLNANVPTPAGRNGMQISTPLGHYVSLGGGIGTDGSNTAGLHIGNQAGQNFGGEGGTLYYDYDAPDRSLVAASAGGIRIAALGQYPPAGRDIIFATNPSNIERMRITDAGNVGIGNADPSQKLDVGGQVRIRGGSPAPGYVLTSEDASGVASWKPSSGGGNVWFSGYYERAWNAPDLPDPDQTVDLGVPGQFKFCALVKYLHDGDNGGICDIKLVGSQWKLYITKWLGGGIGCQAICLE